MIDDDYGTCEATYASLRVYPAGGGLGRVTRLLGLEPTSTVEPSPTHPHRDTDGSTPRRMP